MDEARETLLALGRFLESLRLRPLRPSWQEPSAVRASYEANRLCARRETCVVRAMPSHAACRFISVELALLASGASRAATRRWTSRRRVWALSVPAATDVQTSYGAYLGRQHVELEVWPSREVGESSCFPRRGR